MNSFDGLLQEGSAVEAIEFRLTCLESNAGEYRVDVDFAKGSAIVLSAVSLPLSLTPIGVVGAFVGVVGYAYSLWADAARTKKIYPLPGIRKTVGELFSNAVNHGNGEDGEDLISSTTAYLDRNDAFEYEVLIDHGEKIATLLNSIPANYRPFAYRYLFRKVKSSGYLPATADLSNQIALLQAQKQEVPPPELPPTSPQSTGGNDSIDVVPVGGENPFEYADKERSVSVSLNPEINVHNHLERTNQAPKNVSPPQSDRRVSPPDLSLYPDVRDRMQILLKAMSESGFPLGTLLNHSFVWCWGRSQSGKTTIALLLAIARMAMGHKISYFSTDTDYPTTLNWMRIEDTPEGYAIALDDVRKKILDADKAQLKGVGCIFDEILEAYTEHEIEIQPLLKSVLMRGAKVGAGVIGISQADTSTAHGLKGIDSAWRDERLSIHAIHEENKTGERFPTGRYEVDRDGATEQWFLPEWMLGELNEYGQPDPVIWLIKFFPELLIHHSEKMHETLGSSVRNEPIKMGSSAVQTGLQHEPMNRSENSFEPMNRSSGRGFTEMNRSGYLFMNQQFTLPEARVQVAGLIDIGLNQTQIIQILWKAKKGGTEAYKIAVAEYKFLTGS